ncbi:MAG: GNAT family N-acetyltransferase [Anaerolineae bacterium]|nr:GNAT family N-acetyltransferase [Anaerolineae bacterium]NUQ06825.1 GNAT family N-acetyltransferase [Anaerolineae bacterium]
MLSIRDMKDSDCQPLAEWMVTVPLWQRYGLTVGGAAGQFRAALVREDVLITAEDEEGLPAGFAWMMPKGVFGRSPYLRLIGVRPDRAAQGGGALLLEAIEARAWAVSDVFFLLVSDFNMRAQRFYERHGYTRVGALPDYVVPGVAELIFWKHRAG